ncbi:MAG TPA: hypothetical protein VF868_17085 [Bacteroidia bacterium]|jgi:hypothetical protein
MKIFTTAILGLLFIAATNLSFAQSAGSGHAPKKSVMTAADSSRVRDSHLELRGYIRQMKGEENDRTSEIKPLDSVLVTIYNEDVPYSEIFTNKKGKCSFKLPLDKVFRIEISRKGFVTKSIIINTKVPNEQKSIFNFSFDVDLFESVPGLDVSVLNNPIAKVNYHLATEGFAYDVVYTSKINTELKKMYKNYYRLQKIAADTSLFKADTVHSAHKKK